MPALIRHLRAWGAETVTLTERLGSAPAADLGRVIQCRRRGPWGPVGGLLGRSHAAGEPRPGTKAAAAGLLGRLRAALRGSLSRTLKSVLWFPDEHRWWIRDAVKEGARLLAGGHFDLVFSSATPASAHVVASALRRRFPNLAWVAEYRDLWSQNHDYRFWRVRRPLERMFERRVLRRAAAIVVLSCPWAARIRLLCGRAPVRVVQTGFDERALVSREARSLSPEFTITFTGRLYPGKQDVRPLLQAVRGLLDNGTLAEGVVRLRFFGPRDDELARAIRRRGLQGVTELPGWVPAEVAVEMQRTSQVLLFPNWEDGAHRGVYTGKIYEYLASGRPILATGGHPDVVAGLLEYTGAGIAARSVAEITDALASWYREFTDTGSVRYRGRPERIARFTHEAMARRMAGVFSDAIGRGNRPVGRAETNA